ncbi:hypothetical protein [Rhodoblastus sp.]|uniref:hypothetical protein n=1 Tax=Rhodoblastus sp. TaxID=1962975 RepID=UPI003F9ADC46
MTMARRLAPTCLRFSFSALILALGCGWGEAGGATGRDVKIAIVVRRRRFTIPPRRQTTKLCRAPVWL